MHSIVSTIFIVLVIALVNGHPFDINEKVLDQQEPVVRSESCRSWYNKQGDPKELLAKTLKPPCKIPPSFPRTLIDGWTVDSGCDAAKQPNTCSLHQGAHGCYRHSFEQKGPGAQACYDPQGHWISDPWKGAGTLDAETPSGNLLQQFAHAVADVFPYNDCCVTTSSPQPETCNLYYEKRPPGECEDKPAV